MIRSFSDRDTAKLFHHERVLKWGPDVARAALRKLVMLDAAMALGDLRAIPGLRLEKLGGDRRDTWSIRVNRQWRTCFRWESGDAFDVEIVDYH